ncbi:MAG: nucleotidyl transferase AbiEii/AbiGii toxin family protein [Ekhidna sp.]|nr:nucleotidyl transferase AbiEii/AbiGii toxin family protein [Ekhidna sp.]
MKLHDNISLFRDAVTATAQQLDMLEIYIEKDYWVTYALKTVFASDCKEFAIFKGGTALSKCHKVIERFSEDIDLVVLREEGESGNSLTRKIKSISKVVGDVIEEVDKDGLTSKSGRLRKTAHEYPKIFKGNFGQVRDFIVLEASMLGNFEPYSEMDISSFIYDMMIAQGQEKLAEENQLLPFTINVLDIKRTICEKIMSLVRFSYEEDPIGSLRNKIRHTYDIHSLLKLEEVAEFFESVAFEKMLLKVGNDDVDSYRNNNDWLVNHPSEALIFNNVDETWSELQATYNGDFASLVYGDLPDAAHIAADLQRVSERMKTIEWSINLNQ